MFAGIAGRIMNPAKTKTATLDFETVVAKYGRQVYNIAYRMVGDRHEAEDLTQEAFLKAYKSMSSLKDDDLVDRWLYRIVSNVAIDFLRRKPRRQVYSLNEPISTDEGEVNPEVADWTNSPETKIEMEQFDGVVQLALNELPAEFRLSLILCDVEGLSYEEISRTLGCSIGTVRSRIHRARKAVRDRLTKQSAAYASRVKPTPSGAERGASA